MANTAPRTTATAMAAFKPVESPSEDEAVAEELAASAVLEDEDEEDEDDLAVTGDITVLVLVLPSETNTLVIVVLLRATLADDAADVSDAGEGAALVDGLGDTASGILLYIVE